MVDSYIREISSSFHLCDGFVSVIVSEFIRQKQSSSTKTAVSFNNPIAHYNIFTIIITRMVNFETILMLIRLCAEPGGTVPIGF